ncbi:hypothetical protein AOL_s00043g790 [Orbilia oligospora ATCC 24927]|uniref:Uncharacterized protein n=1 Tax=Arthrobotrys oligospora (strain ATCC 24927 / CBS 115.81 / DSM 1491) TaxID=756982 RepID=G1X516_ARTOA|nr:hypothetical protein AOL_s00043g790 [Orbilia oligospora ATCC 24927]EGX51771.1 hypothetical protein AOL_s00043g790 [Orbilia oligospora ATCC 24927]
MIRCLGNVSDTNLLAGVAGYLAADFFDTKHNIVLGASWATHSRIAGRKTFVNWYQRNYEFAWCTGRLVRDLASPGTD